MNALAAGQDTAVEMIDRPLCACTRTGACIAGNSEELMSRTDERFMA
jgi:hypothetical protein